MVVDVHLRDRLLQRVVNLTAEGGSGVEGLDVESGNGHGVDVLISRRRSRRTRSAPE
jgi:hypothetical protein